MSPQSHQVQGSPHKPTDWSSKVRRRERDTDLDNKKTPLLTAPQECNTDANSNGAERDEENHRAEPAHYGYNNPAQSLGDDNGSDPVSDRDFDIQC